MFLEQPISISLQSPIQKSWMFIVC